MSLSKKTVVLNHLIVLLLVMVFAILGVSVYFDHFEKPYLSYSNIPFPVKETEDATGRYIQLTVTRCNHSGKLQNYTTSHAFENLDTRRFYVLVPFRVPVRPGCDNTTSLINRVPDTIPAGRYRLVGSAEIKGTTKIFNVDWYSQPFELKAKK